LRPIRDLIQVRDVFDVTYNFPYVQPDFNESRFQMYRFLQTPPAADISPASYENKVSTWNADVHLLSTYCFLSKEESQVFAAKDHVYLVKDVHQYKYENITGTKKVKIESSGMVANWMWYFQRNDVNLRNEWDNYSNWPYETMPVNVSSYEVVAGSTGFQLDADTVTYPNINPESNINTGIATTGDYASDNRYHILETMGIVLDGEYRENILTHGVYEYIEKYTRTKGNAKEGLYCYNFCLNTNPFDYQPSGAINLSKFKNIELELTTYIPPVSSNSSFDIICDVSGNPIGVRKANWRLFDYNYNLTVFEERYNVLSFVGGNCGMLYAK